MLDRNRASEEVSCKLLVAISVLGCWLLPLIAVADEVTDLTKALNGPDPKTREAAARKLEAAPPNPAAAVSLASCKVKDTDSKVRSICGTAMNTTCNKAGNDSALRGSFFESVSKSISKESNPEIVARHIHCLKLVKDKRAIPFFVKYLGSPQVELRRAAAAYCLACMSLDETAVAPLLKAMDDGDTQVREGAAVNLGKIGNSRAVGRLVTCTTNDKERDVRSECLRALGRIGDKSAVPTMLAILDRAKELFKNDEYGKRDVLSALGEIKGLDDSVAEKVMPLLGHKNLGVVGEACKVLGLAKVKKALPKLKSLIQENSPCSKLLDCKVRCRNALDVLSK